MCSCDPYCRTPDEPDYAFETVDDPETDDRVDQRQSLDDWELS